MPSPAPRQEQKFKYLMVGLIQEGIYLATAILIEWGLIYLVKASSADSIQVVSVIIEAIEIGSALGALVLFVIHAIRGIVDYWAWKPGKESKEDGSR